MESFLKDTPLEERGSTGEFRAFLDPESVEEPEEPAEALAEEAAPVTLPEDDSQEKAPPEADEPAGEPAVEELSEANPEEAAAPAPEDPAPAEEPPSPATAPATAAGTGEVVFEQVDGPKVEVVSEDGVVSKIVVHLAPDKILEINCEY